MTVIKPNSIYQFNEPTHIDVSKLQGKKILWIFDIDETLLRYDEREHIFYPFCDGIQDWLRKILQANHAVCFLTARLPPPTNIESEKELFFLLKLIQEKDEYYTLHSSVPLFNYTSGALKGPYAKNILSKYVKAENYDAIFFLDDRLTQVEDVITYCSSLHPNLFGIWISKLSQEKSVVTKYDIIVQTK